MNGKSSISKNFRFRMITVKLGVENCLGYPNILGFTLHGIYKDSIKKKRAISIEMWKTNLDSPNIF